MSAAVREAVLNEALDLSYAFRQNAALKHGLPDCKQNRIANLPPEPAPQVNITNQIPAPEVKVENKIEAASAAPSNPSPGQSTVAADTSRVKSLARTAAPWLIGMAAGSGLPAAGWWLTKDNAPPPIVQQDDGSLLQHLEDQGFHLPEGAWPTK